MPLPRILFVLDQSTLDVLPGLTNSLLDRKHLNPASQLLLNPDFSLVMYY